MIPAPPMTREESRTQPNIRVMNFVCMDFIGVSFWQSSAGYPPFTIAGKPQRNRKLNPISDAPVRLGSSQPMYTASYIGPCMC